MLEERVKSFIESYHLINEGEKIGVGVSGGADSMALFFALKRLGYSVVVLHAEHGIREESSLADMRFVEEIAKEQGVLCVSEHLNVLQNQRKGESVEAAARRLRYAFFARAKEMLSLAKIAVAHHKDDAAETILFSQLRGSGLKGMMGIAPMREPGIIRPLLAVSKDEILSYLKEIGVNYVKDETNDSLAYTRNYIRKEILPRFKKINPNYEEALLRTAEILREEDSALQFYEQTEWDIVASAQEDEIFFDIERLCALPRGMQARLLRRAIKQVGTLVDVEKKHIDALISFMNSGKTGKVFELNGRFFARLSYNQLIIRGKLFTIKENKPFSVVAPGVTNLSNGERLIIEETVFPKRFGCAKDFLQYVDLAQLSGAVIRTRMEGDRFSPIGLGGKKKLKDFMIDEKIEREKRDAIPLLTKGNEVLWVIGYAISDTIKITENTEHIAKIEYCNKTKID